MSGFRERLVAALEAAGLGAEVVITQNRSTLLSTKAKRSRRGCRTIEREVRVAGRFAELGEPAIEAIVAFATDRPGAAARVRELMQLVASPRAHYLSSTPHPLSPPIGRSLRSRGRVHDLALIADEERRAHLPGEPAIPVTWGRREPRRRRALRSMRLGTYEPSVPIVRIHNRLDDLRVPEWFVGFIVFHELLHHAVGVRTDPSGTRREMHPPAFRELERRHPRYADAIAWEADYINALASPDW